ncbi:CRISPR-associated protein Cas4 [Ruminococcus flavefaciens]|uniref:CRISPR-associated protein Cas4 n=1 Tax=Ruminococcus flavefaciens TaxID=1265 RepID=UPI000370BD65|nr:CRISPR-associated protein Cas4 [Ruminococcus flavefaciens]
MNEHAINIRCIQHYMYCPRRFALLEINDDWVENAFVVKANIQHQHVHDGSHSYSDSKKIVRSGIAVYNDLPEYDIFGITDCIEFVRSKEGTELNGYEGRFQVRIIEYKPKAPKECDFNETDAIQVFAQKICADQIWSCHSEAYIYYSDTRKRVKLPFDTEYEKYDVTLRKLLSEMRQLLDEKKLPARKKGQKCSGCSMADICFPKEKKFCVRDIIMSQKGADVQ